jgi:hypothetical protein
VPPEAGILGWDMTTVIWAGGVAAVDTSAKPLES